MTIFSNVVATRRSAPKGLNSYHFVEDTEDQDTQDDGPVLAAYVLLAFGVVCLFIPFI